MYRFSAHRFTEDEVRCELEEAGFRMAFFSKEDYAHAVGLAVEMRWCRDAVTSS
jgi:hypothetical protein